MNPLFSAMGRGLARFLTHPLPGQQVATSSSDALERVLKPCDVLPVEGNTRISTAV